MKLCLLSFAVILASTLSLRLPNCGMNEQHYPRPICEGTCDNPDPVPCSHLGIQIFGRCKCKYGYVRATNGTCILKEQCPNYHANCGKNEQIYDQPICEDSCSGVSDCSEITPQNSNNNTICQCSPGFVRDYFCNSGCIRREVCTLIDCLNVNQTCPKNEKWNSCSRCESSCSRPTTDDCAYNDVCVSKCECQDGFYRNEQGRCVRRWECHPITVDPRTQPLTCANVNCGPDYQCIMHTPICPGIRFNCDTTPRPICQARNDTNAVPIALTCDKVQCNPGYSCQIKTDTCPPNVIFCLPPRSYPTCVHDSNTTKPIGCNGMQCQPGFHCVIKPRFCPANTIAPCTGTPTCVSDTIGSPNENKTCDNITCSSDEVCVMRRFCPSLHVSCDAPLEPKCVKSNDTSSSSIEDKSEEKVLSCKNFPCKQNETCIMIPTHGEISISRPICISIVPVLNSCDNFACSPDEMCVMKKPFCPSLRVPCEPRPRCLPRNKSTTPASG